MLHLLLGIDHPNGSIQECLTEMECRKRLLNMAENDGAVTVDKDDAL